MATKKPAATKETKVQFITCVDGPIDSEWYPSDSQEGALKLAREDFDDDSIYYVYKVQLVGKFVSKQTFEEVK